MSGSETETEGLLPSGGQINSPFNWAIELCESSGDGPTLAVKDLIDVEGTITTAGSRLVASVATPSLQDAPVVTNARKGGARIVGKANLTELAFGAQGINPWYGTPVNPISPELIPGGSSSGSAVAVARGIADIAYGTDTGGSIRIPATSCGVIGLKTTLGRASTTGVYPLSQSLDTIGPLAKTIPQIWTGLSWLFGGDLDTSAAPYRSAGRIRTSESELIEVTIDEALRLAKVNLRSLDNPGLSRAWEVGGVIMGYEAIRNNELAVSQHHRIDPAIWSRFHLYLAKSASDYQEALEVGKSFSKSVSDLIENFGALALASVPFEVPSLKNAYKRWINVNTLPFNVAGLPAISFPLPAKFCDAVRLEHGLDDDLGQGVGENGQRVPISVQLVGKSGSDEALVATADMILAALQSEGF